MLCGDKIGKRLKECRLLLGEKQTEIAKLLNVQRQVISYYETGLRIPNINDLVMLAEHFGVSVDYLLGLSEYKSRDAQKAAACKVTGLTEMAADVLEKWNKQGDIDYLSVVNLLIESHGCKAINLDTPTVKYDLNLIAKIATYLFVNIKNDPETSVSISDNNCLSNMNSGISYDIKINQSDLIERILLDSIVDSLKTARKIISASKEGAIGGEHN